jgi:hypothetical protein
VSVKVKIELDLTPAEAKELFIPSDKQTEFTAKMIEAMQQAVIDQQVKTFDPRWWFKK